MILKQHTIISLHDIGFCSIPDALNTLYMNSVPELQQPYEAQRRNEQEAAWAYLNYRGMIRPIADAGMLVQQSFHGIRSQMRRYEKFWDSMTVAEHLQARKERDRAVQYGKAILGTEPHTVEDCPVQVVL